MQNVKLAWGKLPEAVKRVLHTVWQAAGGVLLSALLVAHSTQDVKAAVAVALAAALAAAKGAVLAQLKG